MDRPHLWKPSGRDCWIFIAHCWCNVGGESRRKLEPSRPAVVRTLQLKSRKLFFFFLLLFVFVYQVLMTEKEEAGKNSSNVSCTYDLLFLLQVKSELSREAEILNTVQSDGGNHVSQPARVGTMQPVLSSRRALEKKRKKNNIGDATLKRLSFLLATKFLKCAENTCALLGPRFKIFNAAAFRN